MKLSRRELVIQSSGVFGGMLGTLVLGQFFPGLKLFAQESLARLSEDHLFVLIRTFGAMDCTLGLDPQILAPDADAEDMFLEYRPEDIIQAAGLRLGPAAKPLVPFANDCLVINGVMMRREAAHEVHNQYIATGRGDGKAAAIPVELALALKEGPCGVVTNRQVYLAGKSMSLSATQDLLTGADNGALIEMIEEKIMLENEEKATPFEEAEQKLIVGKDAAIKLQDILKGFKAEGTKLEDRHALAATLASGSAQQAQLDLVAAGNLDTHQNHEKIHLGLQLNLWEQAAEVFKLFKKVPYRGGSLFDSTTFMVISEFSRTPFLNAAKGKDHNPFTNSVLLAGKGINGGTVVGASKLITRKKTKTGMADHIACPYNYKEGKIAEKPEGASFLFPENVIQTIGKIYGSPAGFSPVPATVPVIPGIVKLPS